VTNLRHAVRSDPGLPETAVIPETLLVPLDGSDFALRAAPVATDLARRLGADIVFVTTPHTADPDARRNEPTWLAEAVAEAAAETSADARQVTSRFVDSDDPVAAIIGVAREHPRTTVCMTTHGRGRVLGTALGRVAEPIVRTLGTPVVLVGPHSTPVITDGPVLVCHDGSHAADAILAPARAWAGALGAPLVVVHAIHSRDVASSQRLPSTVTHAAELLGPDTRVHVCRSSFPISVLREVVQDAKPALLAMTTHGRTAWARVALGSVATRLVQASPAPCLVVRPEADDLRDDP
jgi:nucleotide-binding universal stress UspA family protein